MALAQIAERDIFHAKSPNGASLICLALRVTKDRIDARTVTSHVLLSFDRKTGVAEHGDERVPCQIDSVAPLPPLVHKIMLELDEKFGPPHDDGKDSRLTGAQKEALLFIGPFYKAHPLVDA